MARDRNACCQAIWLEIAYIDTAADDDQAASHHTAYRLERVQSSQEVQTERTLSQVEEAKDAGSTAHSFPARRVEARKSGREEEADSQASAEERRFRVVRRCVYGHFLVHTISLNLNRKFKLQITSIHSFDKLTSHRHAAVRRGSEKEHAVIIVRQWDATWQFTPAGLAFQPSAKRCGKQEGI